MTLIGDPLQASDARAISDNGTIVGEAAFATWDATLWSGTSILDLGTLGGSTSIAFGVNDAGQVVGWSYSLTGSPVEHGLLWQNGTM